MSRLALQHRDERGAVAIAFGVSAAMMFGAAAIGVDLGNAMNRRRQAQSQADFAALAGGAHLPGTKSAGDAAVKAVADYLNDNQPPTDGAARCDDGGACVTAAQLVDGNYTNGEVDFTDNGQRMTVTSTVSHIQFGVAAAIGKSSADVAATATVGIYSPGGKPMPMFLPQNCAEGLNQLKDNTNGSGNGNVNLTFDPPSGNGGSIPKIDAVTPINPPGLVPSLITLTGSQFTGGALEADFFQESTNDRVPGNVANNVAATFVSDGSATVTLPPGVFNRPGAWQVRLHNSNGWSRTFARFVVGNPTPLPNGCGVSATGDFGMLDSPRSDGSQLADATSLNIAEGLDHVLQPWSVPVDGPLPLNSLSDNCRVQPGNVALADLDDAPAHDGPRCVEIKNGMNTDTVTDGLITGGTANGTNYDGRLQADTLDGCDRNGGSDETTRLGVSGLNDDVLSCFLPTGVSVGDVVAANVTGQGVHSIDARIFDSPRFSMVPVINYQFNPPNGFYPILRWQPIFITDEPQASTRGNSYATSLNGITTASNKVVGIQVAVLNVDALPLTATGGGSVIPYIGPGTKIVRLIN